MAKRFLTTIDGVDYLIDGQELGDVKGFISVDRTVIDYTDSPFTPAVTDELICADPSGGAIIINMPAGVDNYVCGIKNESDNNTNSITINADGIEKIDGVDSIIMKSARGLFYAYGITGIGYGIQ